MKKCYKCKKLKNEDEFHKDKSKEDGLHDWCKECRKRYGKQWYQKNREHELQQKKQYYQKNREHKMQYQKQWRETHKQQIKQYYQKNKEHKLQQIRQYRKTIRGKFSKYKTNAKRRKLEFNITLEEFESIITKPCFYCGKREELSGIDRMNSNFGYIQGNCFPCCRDCNFAKQSLTVNEFLLLINKIATFHTPKFELINE